MNILEKKLREIRTLAIAGHINPDGDCTGAVLALYHYVRRNFSDIEIRMYLEEPKDKLSYLEGFYEISHALHEGYAPDLFVCLDAADEGRLGFAKPLLESAKDSLCIDHHITNTRYAKDNHIETSASSTCEVLYGLFEKEKIDLKIAECLYTGIIHDTGVFKYSCTSPETMEIAADLMRKGIDFGGMIDEGYYKRSYLQTQILGRALLESVRFANGKCIFSAISQKTMNFFGVEGKDLEGIVSQLCNTDGIEVAIFLYETEPHVYKVSLRSRHIVDVSAIAKFFGGGGHIRAAGCTMVGTSHDIVNNISKKIFEEYKEL
ncbi:MAG: bifunctional oligoribonuclease/PAP phosphatase NrnA [Johnsonella sp.]|nr:bifunctional oligoribonuclease/PAP phosphatase NrnA [Johnsonella sp.]